MDFYSSLNSSQLDTQKPTLFEIASANQLDSLLTPSLRFLLVHYTHKYPRVLIRILNNFEELNALLKGLIEFSYLKKWNATFIEKFYGIKRVNSKPLISRSAEGNKFNEIKRLSKIQLVISLVESVLIPYLTNKLQLYHEKLVPQYLLNTFQTNQSTEHDKDKLTVFLLNVKQKLKYLFFKSYPILKLSLKLINFLFYLLYISDKTSSISLVQYLFNTSYARITIDDHRKVDASLNSAKKELDQNVPPTLSSTVFSNLEKISRPITKAAWSTTDTILPVSIFILKFLEWYNSNSDDTNDDNKFLSNSFKIPIVPTILPINKLTKNEEIIKTNDSNCRICKKQIHNPAIIETGYVFCYKCIYEFLRDQPKDRGGKCPVTHRTLLGCIWSDAKNEWNVKGVRRVIL